MAIKHWLVKQEPSDYCWDEFFGDGTTAWTGVRNYQARNNLREMQRGDLALFYHSGDEKQIVGVARVNGHPYADPTANEDDDWIAVDLVPVKPLPVPVTLTAMRAEPSLKELPLLRHTRLSVMPVTPDQYKRIMQMGGAKGA